MTNSKQHAPPQTNRTMILQGATLVDPIRGIIAADNTEERTDLSIRDGQIVLPDQTPADALKVDLSGAVIIPGLINAHTHCPLTFFRDLGHGHKNMIEDFLFPAEAHLTPDLIAPLALPYIADGLKSGVTTFGDHYYFVTGVGRALEQLGARGVIGETIADLGSALPGHERWESWQETIDNWPFSDRVSPIIAPHACDTVSRALLQELAHFAQERDLGLHMHMSQTDGEFQRVQQREGCTPVEMADAAGALTSNSLCVHLVSATENDLALLRERGCHVGFCPASQILYERLAPIEKFVGHQLNIALATDCAASNDSADLFHEMRIAYLLARDRGVPLSPRDIFTWATIGGAQALGLQDTCGSLEVGKQADLVVLESPLDCQPVNDLWTNLVCSRSARHIRHVMVNGRWVVWDRQLVGIDEQELGGEVRRATKRLQERIS